MTSHAQALKAPGAFLLALEWRAPWEFSAALAAFPCCAAPARRRPRGGGLPGLAASDVSTLPLRAFLAERGYEPHGWQLRFNLGPREGVFERSVERVRKLARSTGRKVSLIGWSLGGVYAREIAKVASEDALRDHTGHPFTGNPRANNAWRIYKLASGHGLDDPDQWRRIREAPPVPTTSVFSRSDGIVAWQCCLQARVPLAESVEVTASHIGMGVNPAAWYAIADRLAQREGLAAVPSRRVAQVALPDPYRAVDPG